MILSPVKWKRLFGPTGWNTGYEKYNPQPETWLFTHRKLQQAKSKHINRLLPPVMFLPNVGFKRLAVGPASAGAVSGYIVTLVNLSDNGKEVSESVYTGLVEP